MFGGSSTNARNARVAKLLNMGFKRAPSTAKLQKPSLPLYAENKNGHKGKTFNVMTAVKRSTRPKLRPFGNSMQPNELLLTSDLEIQTQSDDILAALKTATSAAIVTQESEATYEPSLVNAAPRARPSRLSFLATPITEHPTKTVARRSTSGSRVWTINIGKFNTRYEAERVLLRMALAEMSALDGASRIVKARATGFDALFIDLTEDGANLACRRLHAQQLSCFIIAPS